MNQNKIFCGSYWTPIDLKKSKNKVFHVGNFTHNFHQGLNPGPLAPLASILPLRHKVKELPGPKIWKVIDLSISLVFRQIEQIHLKTFSMQCCTVRSMTSHIFGPGNSLTLWRSGRILVKGARGPGFKSRQRNRKIGFKNKSLHEIFGLNVIWGL